MNVAKDFIDSAPKPPPIRSIRKYCNLSQGQLAAACRCHQSEIGNVETGKKRGERLRTIVWLTYLLYLRHDQWGWLRAALSLPPTSSICTISREDLADILKKLKCHMAKDAIDRVYSSDDH